MQVAAQIWSGVCKGREKEGWSELSPEKGAQGKGEEGERAREGAEAGGELRAGCVRCCLPQISPLTERLQPSPLLLFLLGGSKLDQPSAAFRLIRN